MVYESQGKYEKAEPLYQKNLEIVENKFGKDHLSVAITLNNLAVVCLHQGKYEEIVQSFP